MNKPIAKAAAQTRKNVNFFKVVVYIYMYAWGLCAPLPQLPGIWLSTWLCDLDDTSRVPKA